MAKSVGWAATENNGRREIRSRRRECRDMVTETLWKLLESLFEVQMLAQCFREVGEMRGRDPTGDSVTHDLRRRLLFGKKQAIAGSFESDRLLLLLTAKQSNNKSRERDNDMGARA